MRYAFTNFTNEPFEGRYGGVPYNFASGETREFDPDKHQMLIIMSKQLADKELLKNVKSVGKNPNDQERYGKSLDAEGNVYTLTVEDRKSLMRRAIGELVDVPVPLPADQQEQVEAGATAGDAETKKEISELKEMIAALTAKIGAVAPAPVVTPAPAVEPVQPVAVDNAPAVEAPTPPIPEPNEPAKEVKPVDMGMTRDILFDMAKEANLNPTEDMTKEDLVNLLNK